MAARMSWQHPASRDKDSHRDVQISALEFGMGEGIREESFNLCCSFNEIPWGVCSRGGREVQTVVSGVRMGGWGRWHGCPPILLPFPWDK